MTDLGFPYLIIGLLVSAVGYWLLVAPRESKIGTFLGPMIHFRLLGVLFMLLGIFTAAVGLGLREIGPFRITVG